MVEYILTKTTRRFYGNNHPFCFNVKLHRLNLEFDHLLRIYENIPSMRKSPLNSAWIAAAKEVYEETEQDFLFEVAREHACAIQTDCDTVLPNGEVVQAEFSFEGRSGGWLSLNALEGHNFLKQGTFLELKTTLQEMNFSTLRKLYHLIVTLNYDTLRVEDNVEYHAATYLFNVLCEDLPTQEPTYVEQALH